MSVLAGKRDYEKNGCSLGETREMLRKMYSRKNVFKKEMERI